MYHIQILFLIQSVLQPVKLLIKSFPPVNLDKFSCNKASFMIVSIDEQGIFFFPRPKFF